jgi:hypothetical protein
MVIVARTGRFLALLLLGLCLAACAGKEDKVASPGDPLSEEMRQEIMTIVSDPDRAEQAVELSNELRAVFAEGLAHAERSLREFHALNLDYDTSEAEFRTFFQKFNVETLTRQQKALEIDNRMKAVMTPAEWDELNSARKDLVATYFEKI